MSYSGSVTIPKRTPLRDTAELIDSLQVTGNDHDLGSKLARDNAVAHAKQAAKILVSALNPIGNTQDMPEVGFVVSISGHANPEHRPTPGGSNDMVTLTISQTS